MESNQPIEIKDKLEESEKPTAKDIDAAQELARRVSPLALALFEAEPEKGSE